MKRLGKKLIVMIPCYNEEKTLPLVIKSIPEKIHGISKIETLVIDDGSTDKTSQVAKKLKVNHIIRHQANKGLAQTFADGIEIALKKGAHIIVNTDGDNQYPQKDIPKLIKPILNGKAEIVIADRQIDKIKEFSFIKKAFQKIGSSIIRTLSGTNVPDAPSGFRAYSREAAMQLNIVTEFSYVIETIIQAGKKKITITSIPIKTNPKTRKSRLFKNHWSYIKQSAATIIRVFAMYEPLKTFFYIGGFIFLSGIAFLIRLLYFFFTDTGGNHIQSLIAATILTLIGFQTAIIGLLADLIANNRKLLEEILLKNRKKESRQKRDSKK